MTGLMTHFADDCLRVLIPSGAVLALVNADQLRVWSQVGLVLVNIGYVLWRWRRDARCRCQLPHCPRPKRPWRIIP